MIEPDQVLRLYPDPGALLPLRNLYLESPLEPEDWGDRPFVFTNFVTSLDGRIALPHPESGLNVVPDTIANPRDWRLFQELSARADVLIASGRYLRDLEAGIAQDSLPLSEQAPFADLGAWRQARGMAAQPDVVVVSSSLRVTLPTEWFRQGRRVFLATDADPRATLPFQAQGAEILHIPGEAGISGADLVGALAERGYRRIYSVGGPYVLHTLLRDGQLDTLFLTTVHRLVAGTPAPGFLEGPPLALPLDLRLRWLYLDPYAHQKNLGQCLARYDRAR